MRSKARLRTLDFGVDPQNRKQQEPALSDPAGNMILAMQSILSHHFGAAIEHGQREGTIKKIPLHMLFNTWLGLVHYYLLNAGIFAPGESVLKRYKEELVDSFMVLVSK